LIKIKGKEIRFEIGGVAPSPEPHPPDHRLFTDSKIVRLPPSYGIIHDPEGVNLPRCIVYFGPYTTTNQRVPLDRTAKKYFGSNYSAVRASVDVPIHDDWTPIGAPVVQIWYRRRGNVGVTGPHQGRFFHPFKKTDPPLTLLRCRRYYAIQMPDHCIMNDRGFVFP